jgi:hypothetical protein
MQRKIISGADGGKSQMEIYLLLFFGVMGLGWIAFPRQDVLPQATPPAQRLEVVISRLMVGYG